jgi:hypothetical protein
MDSIQFDTRRQNVDEILSCKKNDGYTLTFKVLLLSILIGKYFEMRTWQEQYISGFVTIMNKIRIVVSQHSNPWLQ